MAGDVACDVACDMARELASDVVSGVVSDMEDDEALVCVGGKGLWLGWSLMRRKKRVKVTK